jgi:8-oxo-dGTP pyrophosphatase MutT (NUDIX family)
MVKEGWIEKIPSGAYQLTTTGKAFANNLNEEVRTVLKQPKVSVMIVASQQSTGSTQQFLLHKRARHPFYGLWGFLSGPVLWGELPEETAKRELQKQTGLSASFSVASVYRQRSYRLETDELLEDGLFIVLHAHNIQGTLSSDWQGGDNAWFEKDKIKHLAPKFKETYTLLDAFDNPSPYSERSVSYGPDEY